MKRPLLMALLAIAFSATIVLAQTPAQPTPTSAAAARAVPPASPAPAAPRPQPVNIRIDITISVLGGTVTPAKKTVSLVTGDGLSGSIRNTSADTGGFPTMPLNIDAKPTLVGDGKVRLLLNLTYDTPTVASDQPRAPRAGISESLQVILDSGKSIVVAESPAPIGDFQYTIEIKATVLK